LQSSVDLKVMLHIMVCHDAVVNPKTQEYNC